MKKTLFFLFILPSILWAAPVDPNMAQHVAENFINAPIKDANGVSRAPKKHKMMAKVAKQVTDNQQFYVFNNENGEGFVIVAADDVARPILGYSQTGTMDVDNLPDNLRWWLSEYDREIRWAQENNIEQSKEIKEKWDDLYNSRNTEGASFIVYPLISTKWHQAPYYNDLCPYYYKTINILYFIPYDYKTEIQAPTGCAATALAQVMKFWERPLRGTGYHQYNLPSFGTQSANFANTIYDWDNMPNQLTENSTPEQVKAVATLMYHCGVALDMQYGPYESGIRDAEQIVSAVRKYFRYSDNTQSITKVDFSEEEWESILKNQLDKHQPMVYCGIGDGGGHAFVCDGYNNQNQFNFNWGWSGNGDGLYSLTSLTPPKSEDAIGAGNFDFTSKQYAVIDMTPKAIDTNLQLYSNWTLSSESINYGGTLAAQVSVKNCGQTAFKGDITLLVLDENFNYFTELPIKTDFTLDPNSSVTLTPYVSGYAGLIPGTYYVILGYNNTGEEFQLVGSDYYVNATTFSVYHAADLEMYSNYVINSEDDNLLLKGKKATIGITIKNNNSSKFSGKLGLVIAQPDMSIGQDFGEIEIDTEGIPAGETRTISFTGRITMEPGKYLLMLAYIPSGGTLNFVGSTYHKNPIYIDVIGSESGVLSGKYIVVANRQKESDNNWYYMTSDLGTASTKRFQAINTNTTDLHSVPISELDNKYIWQLEAFEENWKLKNGDKYVTWTSGNSANLSDEGKILKLDVVGNCVRAHFKDGIDERCLALNLSNDYFAFYSATNQINDLYFLPYEEPENITIRAKIPSDWGETISAWTWGENNSGSWVELECRNGWCEYTTLGYEANVIFVNGSTWNGDNNQTIDICVKGSVCIVIGNDKTGKRSYTFADCPQKISVKAKVPADWSNTISAWVWDENTTGEWVSLEKKGEWYSYSRFCNAMNIIFVNGTTWNGDNNQTIDITTTTDACYQINSNSGKRYVVQIPCEEEIPEPQIEIDNYVVLAQRNASSNWFYMTSDLGTASSKRYQAVDAGTANLTKVNTENLSDKYYWQIEENKLHTAAGYSTWKSGNSANLDDVGKDLSIDMQDDGTYVFSFTDGEDTRRLAFNKTAGNDYFAYYKGTDQIYKLTLLKEGENGSATSIESIFKNESSVATKLLRNGQILILRGEKVYTITGQAVK